MSLPEKRKSRLSRRDFLKLVGLGCFSGLFYGTQIEPGWLDLVQMPLTLPRLDIAFSGFRMVQISDIHMGGWMNRERLETIVDVILEQEPDLVAITGDFVVGGKKASWYVDKLDDLLVALKRLSSKSPTIAVMGNHDYYTDVSMVREMLSKANVVELKNDVFSLTRDFSSLHFCGVDDMMLGFSDLDGVLANLPELGSAILLAHEPDFADIAAPLGRFDLQISGHSHGGQVVLFGNFLPIVPPLAEKYPSGLYKIGKMQQYTNRGLGMSHLNIRLNCRPEITVFTLMAP